MKHGCEIRSQSVSASYGFRHPYPCICPPTAVTSVDCICCIKYSRLIDLPSMVSPCASPSIAPNTLSPFRCSTVLSATDRHVRLVIWLGTPLRTRLSELRARMTRIRRFVALSPQDPFPLEMFSHRATVSQRTFPDVHQFVVQEVRKRIRVFLASEMIHDVLASAFDELIHSRGKEFLVVPEWLVGGVVSVGIRLVLTLTATLALRHLTANCGAVSIPGSNSTFCVGMYLLRSSCHLSHYLEYPEHPRHC